MTTSTLPSTSSFFTLKVTLFLSIGYTLTNVRLLGPTKVPVWFWPNSIRRGPRVAWPLSARALNAKTIGSAASLYFVAFFMHVAESVTVAARDAPPVTGAAAEVVAAAFTTQPTLMIVSPHFFQTSV